MKNLCLGCMKEMAEGQKICPYCQYVAGTEAPEKHFLKPGTMIKERYLVGRSLGAGGFGITYIGYDMLLQAAVAIKEYMPGNFGTRAPGESSVAVYTGENAEDFAKGKQRFLNEAARLAQLSNQPEIVSVYDCFEENATAYIVMELLEGETLKAKLKREGRISVDETVRIMTEVLKGLEKVHAKGMLHRDIAPDNIFLTNKGEVKLFDFGTARAMSSGRTRSLTTEIKRGYSPMEQYRSHGNQGPWTDVYAAAATCYRALTGKVPEDSLARMKNDTLVPPSKRGVKIGKSLENAILNALCVVPEERTQSAAEFLQQIENGDTKKNKVKKRKEDIGKMPLFIKILIPAALAVIAGFAFLITSGRISFQAQKSGNSSVALGMARVGNYVNNSVSEATEQANANGLSIEITDKEYSETIPVGRILSQSVQAGTLVEQGSTVGVVLSAGIEQTYAPWITGLSKEAAEAKLLELGFKSDFTEAVSNVAPGHIVTQTPDPETAVNTGDTIHLTVSVGNPDIDTNGKVDADLQGMSWDEALALAQDKGFYIFRSETKYDDAPENTIISSEKETLDTTGQMAVYKTAVSAGRERTMVPDLTGNTKEVVESMLASYGLSYAVAEEVYSTETDAGKVIRQDLDSGTRVPMGTVIHVTMSLGEQPTEPETQATQAAPRQQAPVQQAPVQQAPTVPVNNGEPPTISDDFG